MPKKEKTESDLVKTFVELLESGCTLMTAKKLSGIYQWTHKNKLSLETLTQIKEISENYRIQKHLRLTDFSRLKIAS